MSVNLCNQMMHVRVDFDITCYSMFVLFADIDECETGEHNCSQTCSNTLGSFECKCRAGYSLQDDGVTCAGRHSYIHTYVHIRTLYACVSLYLYVYDVPECVCVHSCMHMCMLVCAQYVYACVHFTCTQVRLTHTCVCT